MKLRAFLQALFLVLFLVGSWFFLIMRLNREEPANDGKTERTESAASRQEEPGATEDLVSGETASNIESPSLDDATAPVPPESWNEWIAYLESAASPDMMRGALTQLADSIFAMPRGDAIGTILEFLESGADMKTGLAFQPGPDNSMVGTNSLRAFLLDVLQQLDPKLAAQWAVDELTRSGTALAPDVYAVHLRNYALGSEVSEEARTAFLNNRLEAVLQNDVWTSSPTTAIAEMMDVAVYTGATTLLPDLSKLINKGDPQMLRRAAALAIERLVDKKPMAALSEILAQKEWPAGMEKARAGYFARLDPGIDGAPQLLEDYLSAPSVTGEEARFFLLSFPNLNQSLSHNLLSSQISITSAERNEKILANALELVRAWQDDPGLSRLKPTLEEVEQAINERLYGRVYP